MTRKLRRSEVIIVGGGLAGLAAAIYLGRAQRQVLVIDGGRSMARWEPDVQNYLGFPKGIAGQELLKRGRLQARRYHVGFAGDCVQTAKVYPGRFALRGEQASYSCKRLLLSTGIFHLPPDLPDVEACLGRSMFFCKDCDGFRVRGRRIAIYGWTNEAAYYALAMLLYTTDVVLVTDGRLPQWDRQHSAWIRDCRIPCFRQKISKILRKRHQLQGMEFSDGQTIAAEALFTTRGDVYFNDLARQLRADVDKSGEIIVDAEMRTNIPGLYAAGCVTPANCQMIIAAGQGAVAAQAINSDLLAQSLRNRDLHRVRFAQLRGHKTPDWLRARSSSAFSCGG